MSQSEWRKTDPIWPPDFHKPQAGFHFLTTLSWRPATCRVPLFHYPKMDFNHSTQGFSFWGNAQSLGLRWFKSILGFSKRGTLATVARFRCSFFASTAAECCWNSAVPAPLCSPFLGPKRSDGTWLGAKRQKQKTKRLNESVSKFERHRNIITLSLRNKNLIYHFISLPIEWIGQNKSELFDCRQNGPGPNC